MVFLGNYLSKIIVKVGLDFSVEVIVFMHDWWELGSNSDGIITSKFLLVASLIFLQSSFFWMDVIITNSPAPYSLLWDTVLGIGVRHG
jgi:hypothetical protein